MGLSELIRNPARCNELLNTLNTIAREVSSAEYGLPLYDEAVKAQLREALYRWVVSDVIDVTQVIGERVWPQTAEAVIDFIGSNFSSKQTQTLDGELPLDKVVYSLTVHDLLSAFDQMDVHPGEPALDLDAVRAHFERQFTAPPGVVFRNGCYVCDYDAEALNFGPAALEFDRYWTGYISAYRSLGVVRG